MLLFGVPAKFAYKPFGVIRPLLNDSRGPQPLETPPRGFYAHRNINYMADTNKEFDQVTAKCRQIFIDKMKDYGPSWRIFRLHGITDRTNCITKAMNKAHLTSRNLKLAKAPN